MSVQSTPAGSFQEPVNKSKHANAVAEPGSRFTYAIAVICASALVIASMGFGAVFAYSSGLQHGIELALLSVLFAVALEGIKPLAVSAAFQSFASWSLGRGLAMTALALVAIAYSLTAELSLLAQTRGDATAIREASIKARTAADAQRKRLEDELSALGITRPLDEIAAEQRALMTALRLDSCEGWLQPKQRTVCAEQIAPLTGELARAARRDALQRELATTGTGPVTAAGAADAGATALATYLNALGVAVPVAALSQWLVLVPVLALELGSALSVLLVRSAAPARGTAVRTPVKYDTAAHSESPVTAASDLSGQLQESAKPPRRGQASKRADRTATEAAILDALKSDGGKLSDGTVRTLAGRIGASKSTVHSALAVLIASGAVAQSGGELVLRSAG